VCVCVSGISMTSLYSPPASLNRQHSMDTQAGPPSDTQISASPNSLPRSFGPNSTNISSPFGTQVPDRSTKFVAPSDVFDRALPYNFGPPPNQNPDIWNQVGNGQAGHINNSQNLFANNQNCSPGLSNGDAPMNESPPRFPTPSPVPNYQGKHGGKGAVYDSLKGSKGNFAGKGGKGGKGFKVCPNPKCQSRMNPHHFWCEACGHTDPVALAERNQRKQLKMQNRLSMQSDAGFDENSGTFKPHEGSNAPYFPYSGGPSGKGQPAHRAGLDPAGIYTGPHINENECPNLQWTRQAVDSNGLVVCSQCHCQCQKGSHYCPQCGQELLCVQSKVPIGQSRVKQSNNPFEAADSAAGHAGVQDVSHKSDRPLMVSDMGNIIQQVLEGLKSTTSTTSSPTRAAPRHPTPPPRPSVNASDRVKHIIHELTPCPIPSLDQYENADTYAECINNCCLQCSVYVDDIKHSIALLELHLAKLHKHGDMLHEAKVKMSSGFDVSHMQHDTQPKVKVDPYTQHEPASAPSQAPPSTSSKNVPHMEVDQNGNKRKAEMELDDTSRTSTGLAKAMETYVDDVSEASEPNYGDMDPAARRKAIAAKNAVGSITVSGNTTPRIVEEGMDSSGVQGGDRVTVDLTQFSQTQNMLSELDRSVDDILRSEYMLRASKTCRKKISGLKGMARFKLGGKKLK